MAQLAFEYVSRSFGSTDALVGLNLAIESGEFFALIGSSGCGKSTALRIAAGLETPDHGEVVCDGEVITRVPTRKRGFGMVTQQNALVGARSARGNIALPLELERTHREEISVRVDDDAERLAISHLLDRRRDELSGGEVQAVQLTRAMIARPRVLLLDEPLARIDLDLRTKLRMDLARIQRDDGSTTLLVTADQEDAMVLADRIAVLHDGHLQQVGPPLQLHDRPVNVTVATFLGDPPMNIIPAHVVDDGGLRFYLIGGQRFPAHPPVAARFAGGRALVGIRPYDIRVERRVDDDAIAAHVEQSEFRGSSTVLTTTLDQMRDPLRGGPLCLRITCAGAGPRAGATVGLHLDGARFHLFDPYTGAALAHPL
mgnify:FL=1